MKPVNSLLKAVRPLSLAISNTLYPSSHNIKQSYNSQQRKSNPKAALVINLIDCQISVDYGVAQKDFVFRIVTEDGAQYILQAINQEEMNDWMHVISEASNQALKKRMTIPIESLTYEDKPTYAEPKTRNSVYGKDLATLMKDGNVPLIVEKCLTEIEKRGLEEVGIYRVPGAALAVESLRSAFNTNAETVDVSVEKYGDINVVAGALKSFFRSLPEPVMSCELYDDFINSIGISDYDERHLAIKALLQRLPGCNYILLKRLIEHLERVTDYSEINHMYANNLAIVFGPTLLKAPPGPSSFAQSMGNLGKQTTIVKDLILQYHWFFDVEDDASDVELSELIADHDGVENDELESNHDTSSYVEVDSASADGSVFANTRESEEGDMLGEDHELWDYGKKMENYQDKRQNDGSINKFGSFQMRIEHIDDGEKKEDMMNDQQTDQLIAGSVANRGSVLTDVTEEQEDDFEMVE